MNKLLVSITWLIFISFSAQTQDTLRVLPGSSDILYSKIKPHVIKSRFTVIRDNQRKDYGIYKDSIAFVKKGNEEFLVRFSFFPARKLYDTAFYQPKTLVSISNSEYSSSGVMRLKYSRDKVTGQNIVKPKDSLIIIDQRMETPFFDGYLNDFLPRFLKLKENYCAKIPLYAFGTTGTTWITALVLRSEKILATNNKQYEVWIVELRWPNSPFKVDLYVEKQTRDLLKIHIKGPGSEIVKDRIDF